MSEPETVLIVDDDPDILNAARMRLENAGYDTLAAADGESAVAIAEACHPDGVLMDVQMPVMDGITALKEIKRPESSTEDIPVVITSSDELYRQVAKDGGAQAFVKKPHQGAAMVKTVTAAIDEHAAADRTG